MKPVKLTSRSKLSILAPISREATAITVPTTNGYSSTASKPSSTGAMLSLTAIDWSEPEAVDKKLFYEASIIVCNAVINFANRYAQNGAPYGKRCNS